MIVSWRGEAALAVWEGRRARLPPEVVRRARNKLLILAAGKNVEAMREPPGNRLHPLTGDRAGQWAVRINDQYRLCFRWTSEGAADVEITDYH